MTAHPFASLVETTQQDAPEPADLVMADDDSLSFLAEGDARDRLRGLADTASLEDLRAGWRTAQQVRAWALDLCERVEAELDAGQPAEAVTMWLTGRGLPSGCLSWRPCASAAGHLPAPPSRRCCCCSNVRCTSCSTGWCPAVSGRSWRYRGYWHRPSAP
ncbi:hypothetical protein OHB05_38975 [Streptomyces sp. NBC_00638]|uniref:hypothetical protein n=1 Tax=unclassified Streptomyces TaxID=2593676 RepID=UPI0022512890|nr:hypothetical protein [Streptomyces sp. NBC_00638]MCX5008543.1 hypothetical protein [Streptomyces sp. NBC_00638]